MKLDFHFWLRRTIGRLPEPKAREPVNAFSRDEERDRSAHEYELHYWGAMPGLWY
ncbi:MULTISPECIES: hypothetical protein [unclassified Rhizobium]|uniref:hypothetical protein n=1 Tax=unclassified Rhizobium TaxID=2613769 RepID=UPI001A98ACFB|nr:MULTISPECIES: hypothetical protein [unclassified Rhizobium]MBX5156710.1 hypothetical protein [Rhizobium sp. NZLR8]MBX5162836.1 hypothetical protein [Rhizobium sp. NZLR4b]MBX5168429.1 hypothetical protein [Rhizobium sp. NZLR1b]MBX5181961.1 hypothetical protein [Rhizobium sp. NZLR5]MBX5187695.1 hypothetical protein [Rhizobium sp. NZLR3b]